MTCLNQSRLAPCEETRYLLRSRANADRLIASISELDQGAWWVHDLGRGVHSEPAVSVLPRRKNAKDAD